jgi:hypothetical protein
MLRFAEFGLFLVPFALYVAWRVLGARASFRLVCIAAAMLALMLGAVVWYGLDTGLGPGATYVPAHIENGRIVPGHGN